jgi:23S rRNA (guanine745-N1)-methyltransferase
MEGKLSVLLCPHCRERLQLLPKVATCKNGHSFDRAREGYFNLRKQGKSKGNHLGDNKAQLRNRAAFLESGAFDPLVDHLNTVCAGHQKTRKIALLDSGCGNGHYTDSITASLEQFAPVDIYAFDISKDAVAMTAKMLPHATNFVTDIWDIWPVQSGSIDIVLNIFSPKSFPEKSRVLTKNGALVIAFPGPQHLVELRELYSLMDIESGKEDRYRTEAEKFFQTVSVERISWELKLSPEDVSALILMGPNQKHVPDLDFASRENPISVSAEVFIMVCKQPLTEGSSLS